MQILSALMLELETLLTSKGHIYRIKSNAPLKEKEIIKFSKKLNLSEEQQQFYNLYNGLSINWFSDKGFLCGGRLYIPDLKTLENYILKNSKSDLTYFSEFIQKGFIPLDVDNINKKVTFITYTDSGYKLIHVNELKQEEILKISITDYIALAVKTGGLSYWQYYLSEENYCSIKKYSYDFFYDVIKDKLNNHLLTEFYLDKNVENRLPPSNTKFSFKIPANASVLKQIENDGCSPIGIRKAEMALDVKLPFDFIEFFYQKNGFELYWKNDVTFSNIHFLGIEKIFGGDNHSQQIIWNNNYYTYVKADKSFSKKWSRYYPLLLEESGHTVFTIEKNEIQLYVIKGIEEYKLNLTFNQFIEKIHEFGGTHDWQKLFMSEYHSKHPDVVDLINGLKSSFPDLSSDAFTLWPKNH